MPKAIKKETKTTTKKAAEKKPKKATAAAAVKKPKKAAATAAAEVKKPKKVAAATVKKPKKAAAPAAPKAPKLKIRDKAMKALVETIIDGIQDVKGKNVVVLDLTQLPNAVTDYFVIATGESSTQVESMASAVVRKTRKELKEKPWHEEGVGNSEWILLDYVNVVVHIFYRDIRTFYNLEDLWADAERTDIPNLD